MPPFFRYQAKNRCGGDSAPSSARDKAKKGSELLIYQGLSDVVAHHCSFPTFQFANDLKCVT